MDRSMVYTGAVPLDTDWLFPQRSALTGLAKLAEAVLGTSPVVDGLLVQPTLPTSLSVNVTPGQIYGMASVDPVAYGSMAADTGHLILKQGILMDALRLPITAPGTAGFSQWFLVQVSYQDKDDGSVVLPYYNSSNPQQPFAGPGNSGQQQYTQRLGVATIQIKAGSPAPTGSHVQPQPDPGWTGLAWVNVANGQAVILAQQIVNYTPSSRLSAKLPALAKLSGAKIGIITTGRTLTSDDIGLSVVDCGGFDGPIDVYLPPAGSIPGVPIRHKCVGRFVTPRSRRSFGYGRFRAAAGDSMDASFAYCGPNDALEFVSDGLSRWYWVSGRQSSGRYGATAVAQVVPSGVTTAVTLIAPNEDQLPGYWNPSFPSRIYIPSFGRYVITANVAFLPVTNGFSSTRAASINLNGAPMSVIGYPSANHGILSGDGFVVDLAGGPVGLYDGDYIDLMVFQNSGGPLSIQPALTWIAVQPCVS